jgi:dTDP-4-dehydrorhamnose reductase|tara:strand:+ start:3243 stop:3920 length:678 start_codon:yes stop_codon:yes gene_type:complete
MIIGNGLVASGLKNFDNPDYVILASGVSNSSEVDAIEFQKEEDLVLETIRQHPTKKIIYFSTALIPFVKNSYYRHKRKMELLIQDNAKRYVIYRVPQLVSNNGNPNNLVNYLKNKIRNEEVVTVYEGVYRSLLDIEDLAKLVDITADKIEKGFMNISGVEAIKVINICEIIALILDKPLHLQVQSKDEDSGWIGKNSSLIDSSINLLAIDQGDYTKNLIKKYVKK